MRVEKYAKVSSQIKKLSDEEKEALMADLVGSYIYKTECNCLEFLLEDNMKELSLHVKKMNSVGKQILDAINQIKDI